MLPWQQDLTCILTMPQPYLTFSQSPGLALEAHPMFCELFFLAYFGELKHESETLE